MDRGNRLGRLAAARPLHRTTGLIARHPDTQLVYANGLRFEDGKCGRIHSPAVIAQLDLPLPAWELLRQQDQQWFIQSGLFRRSCRRRWTRFDDKTGPDDWPLNIRLFNHFSHRSQYHYVDADVVAYRQHAGNSFRNVAAQTQRKLNVLNRYCPAHLKDAALADACWKAASRCCWKARLRPALRPVLAFLRPPDRRGIETLTAALPSRHQHPAPCRCCWSPCTISSISWRRQRLIGVDLFFVISGYLMTQILAVAQVTRLRSFPAGPQPPHPAGADRVVPDPAGTGLVHPSTHQPTLLGWHAGTSLLFISNLPTTTSGLLTSDLSASRKWLLHTRSLSVEWQFYLLYPALFATALPWSPLGCCLRDWACWCRIGSGHADLGSHAQRRVTCCRGAPEMLAGVGLFCHQRWQLAGAAMAWCAIPAAGRLCCRRCPAATCQLAQRLHTAAGHAGGRFHRHRPTGAGGTALAGQDRRLVVFDLPVALAGLGLAQPAIRQPAADRSPWRHRGLDPALGAASFHRSKHRSASNCG